MAQTIEIRVTKANVNSAFVPGDVIVGAEDLGPVRSARLTVDGHENAMVYGEKGRDVLGLPSTVQVVRA